MRNNSFQLVCSILAVLVFSPSLVMAQQTQPNSDTPVDWESKFFPSRPMAEAAAAGAEQATAQDQPEQPGGNGNFTRRGGGGGGFGGGGVQGGGGRGGGGGGGVGGGGRGGGGFGGGGAQGGGGGGASWGVFGQAGEAGGSGFGAAGFGATSSATALGNVPARLSTGVNSVQISPADRPIVVDTQPMTAQTRGEWKEDLNIMDKLLRDAISGLGGESPAAMGIRVTMSDNIQPIYIEGCGMLLSYGVNMPLSAGTPGDPNAAKAASAAPTPWERAKRELTGESPAVENLAKMNWTISTSSGRTLSAPVKFDQNKLDELFAVLLKTLPEAKNVRHLEANEFVFVTITGFDDAGAPLRLSLKAKKADIDNAAAGKLSPEEFKKRVVWQIG